MLDWVPSKGCSFYSIRSDPRRLHQIILACKSIAICTRRRAVFQSRNRNYHKPTHQTHPKPKFAKPAHQTPHLRRFQDQTPRRIPARCLKKLDGATMKLYGVIWFDNKTGSMDAMAIPGSRIKAAVINGGITNPLKAFPASSMS